MNLTVTLDRAGRIVLPKVLRDQFALRPGSELEVSVRADHLQLKPVEITPTLVLEGALWVHQGTADFSLETAVGDARDERSNKVGRQAIPGL